MHEHASTINNNPVTKTGEMSMSSRPKGNESAKLQAASTQADTPEASVGNLANDEDIRRRAYEIYRERGEQPDHDLDDWLQAERELQGGVLSRAQAGSVKNP
jgi:hypothetical protein